MSDLELIILFLFSFLPPLIYAIWIRNTEKHHREKWIPIIICFLWGATIAIIASLLLELMLGFIIIVSFQQISIYSIIITVLIAPFVEEFTKPIVLNFQIIKKELDELEDGLIYGAIAGLGFSATENLFYGFESISESFIIFLVIISVRSIGACLLHASATAWTGYGFGKKVMKVTSIVRVLPYFLLAIFVHALYNSLLVFGVFGAFLSFVAAISLSLITIYFVRKKIRILDESNI